MHNNNIVHGDLKPSNILIDGTKAVLTDFGLSITLSYSEMTVMMKGGTHGYMAPELYSSSFTKCAKKCDIYSLGAIFYEMMNG